jgi:phosphoribosylformimino-5-aminoimidazole carboxamide ribotide isomerase
VTSWLFPAGRFAPERLAALVASIGRKRLVIDLSCRRRGRQWLVAIDRWQTITEVVLDAGLFAQLAESCSEFLIHAADVEGLCNGIDVELVEALGRWSPLPCTYAGGGRAMSDLSLVEATSSGRIDLTIGSALDLFGGTGVRYAEAVAWNHARLRAV